MGEHVDRDDSGVGREPDDSSAYGADSPYNSESVIRPDIAWRGPRLNDSAARKLTPVAGGAVRRDSVISEGAPAEALIVGSSAQAKALRERIKMYAADTAPVLIIGETGVGKELVARALHSSSDRCDAGFVAVNSGAISETLAASELFGHIKGSYTGAHTDRDGVFAQADRGVLFLDEIGDLPLSLQAQLLRVLDDGHVTRLGARTPTKVDFRLVAATNIDLRRAVMCGQFRRDLFHRINVLIIEVPPLRERGDDVIEIAQHMIRNHKNKSFRNAKLTPNAIDRLLGYPFPGNVRELKNVLTRALVHAQGGKIFVEHLSFNEARSQGADAVDYSIADAKDLISRYVVLRALVSCDGNVSKAADSIGRARSTVHAVMKQIDGGDFAAELEKTRAALRAFVDYC